MPVVKALMDKLVEQYGEKKGEDVYYSMEASGKGPFAKGAKHHDLHEAWAQKHGVAPVSSRRRKAPPAKRKGPRRR